MATVPALPAVYSSGSRLVRALHKAAIDYTERQASAGRHAPKAPLEHDERARHAHGSTDAGALVTVARQTRRRHAVAV